MTVFVDSGPLRAFVSPKDQFYKDTLQIAKLLTKQNTRLITTDYIISEVFTGLVTDPKGRYYQAQKFDEQILQKKIVDIEWITQDRFFQAKSVLLKFSRDKRWSFTDCVSYVIMKELKIKTAFTFDEHFEQMGFTLL